MRPKRKMQRSNTRIWRKTRERATTKSSRMSSSSWQASSQRRPLGFVRTLKFRSRKFSIFSDIKRKIRCSRETIKQFCEEIISEIGSRNFQHDILLQQVKKLINSDPANLKSVLESSNYWAPKNWNQTSQNRGTTEAFDFNKWWAAQLGSIWWNTRIGGELGRGTCSGKIERIVPENCPWECCLLDLSLLRSMDVSSMIHYSYFGFYPRIIIRLCQPLSLL